MSNSQIPLVLAGPIVRRVATDGVTVWVALSRATGLTLTVTRGESEVVATGVATPIKLGERLYVAAVTARPVADPLPWGAEYSYDLAFEGVGTLGTDGVLGPHGPTALGRLLYEGRSLPSLRLAAATREGLVIAHGSCRKPHGAGPDALALMDGALHDGLRHHREGGPAAALFLTGDQIYADDVSAEVLRRILTLKQVLFGGDEQARRTPFTQDRRRRGRAREAAHTNAHAETLPLDQRASLVKNVAKFTTGKAENHLLTFSEYALMYLLVWSDVPWRLAGPEPTPVSDPLLVGFYHDLPAVRRVLANVPTWMIFDDHDVTDDWNRTRAWVDGVGGSALGRQVVQSALVAYAVFQHWGNAPERFEAGTPGRAMLSAISGWLAGEAADAQAVERAVFVPCSAADQAGADAFEWSWTLDLGPCRVHAPDCRTRRELRGKRAQPGLLCEAAREDLLGRGGDPERLDVLLLPTPILGEAVFKVVQDLTTWASKHLNLGIAEGQLDDVTDCESWRGHPATWKAMIDGLAMRWRRVVILSGDVHYAYASTLTGGDVHVVNFTSSALKNRSFPNLAMRLLRLRKDALHERGRHMPAAFSEPGAAARDEDEDTALLQPASRRLSSLTLTESLVDMAPVSVADEGARAQALSFGAPSGETDRALRRGDVLGEPNIGIIRFERAHVAQRLLYHDPLRPELRRELIHRVDLPPR